MLPILLFLPTTIQFISLQIMTVNSRYIAKFDFKSKEFAKVSENREESVNQLNGISRIKSFICY